MEKDQPILPLLSDIIRLYSDKKANHQTFEPMNPIVFDTVHGNHSILPLLSDIIRSYSDKKANHQTFAPIVFDTVHGNQYQFNNKQHASHPNFF